MFFVTLLLASCNKEDKKDVSTPHATAHVKLAIPSLDVSLPMRIETATFGLG